MFGEDDDLQVTIPSHLRRNKRKSRKAPIQRATPAAPAPKKQVPKRKPAPPKKPLQAQDFAAQFDREKDTLVAHESGDFCWNIIPEDAVRLSDHQIYAYMYKRFGYKARELRIIRPKNNSSRKVNKA